MSQAILSIALDDHKTIGLAASNYCALWTKERDLTFEGGMIDDDAAVDLQLLKISSSESAKPTLQHVRHNDGEVEMATFKHCKYSAPNKLMH